VGSGFAGVQVVRRLAGHEVDVTLVDRRNYNTFQPLLYQVATSGLDEGDVAHTVRALFADDANVDVQLGTVVGLDRPGRRVELEDGASLPYDALVIAAEGAMWKDGKIAEYGPADAFGHRHKTNIAETLADLIRDVSEARRHGRGHRDLCLHDEEVVAASTHEQNGDQHREQAAPASATTTASEAASPLGRGGWCGLLRNGLDRRLLDGHSPRKVNR